MASYRQGTITVTQGSKIVTGVDTAFNVVGIYAGDIFSLVDGNNIPTGSLYEVASVESDTKLTLLQAYQGTSGSAKNYVIMNMAGNQTTPRFSAKVSNLLGEVQEIADGLSEDAIPSGIPQGDSSGKLARGWLPLFTAASSSAAGQAGAVPAPEQTNQPKYLLSNATWANGIKVTFVSDSGINLNTYYDSGLYAFLSTAAVAGTNFPTSSGGILEVIGNGSGQIYHRFLGADGNLYLRNGANTGTFTDWRKFSFLPSPQTAEGAGQWTALSSEPGEALGLPSGGTWAYVTTAYNSDGTLAGYNTGLVGVKAGGSSIVGSGSIFKLRGFAWRIA